jgi:AraC-like DNA-binding protein
MPLETFVQSIEAIAARLGQPMLGWQVGLATPVSVFGEVGEAAAAARCLGGLLQRIVDYFGIVQDAADISLACCGDSATLSYRIVDPDIWPREQDALFTLGILARTMRGTPGVNWSDAELGLESDGTGLRGTGARLGFNAETNFIRFPAAWLDLPNAMAKPQAPNHGWLTRQVALRRRRLPVATRVRHCIFQSLHNGTCQQDSVAATLGMSSRTLRRRLADEGVSFQILLDSCRMRLAALEFRLRPEASIAETALRLGYSEHSTFTRAFARWNGVPPQAYLRDVNQAA